MPTSPGPLLTVLDALWERLRADVPELPRIRPTVSPTTRRRDHGPERWTSDDDGSVSGFVATADVLSDGADAVLTMVLHEAAHVLNWVRDIKDTTMRGAYHNQAFLAAAEEVGLLWHNDAQRTAGRGYEGVALSSEARERHREDLDALGETIPLVLPHLELPTSSSAGRVDRLTLRCSCDPARSFRISQTVAAKGPILCGVCGAPFTEE
ncbi:hypothetical protein [Streptomyces sp. NBC_00076]|uniref:hypothetical protein n=1 Tax=Streptomyces sp. NBC_00076 TaxID=2975642 RepID=UPI0032431F5E